ncbi:MAG TPA: hypothetical protein VM123_20995 [archaeon]|nr:hypothetical protein [archaeon]
MKHSPVSYKPVQKHSFPWLISKRSSLWGLGAAFCLAFLLIVAGGCNNETPLGPNLSQTLPVENSSQLEGRWSSVSFFVQGLPVSAYLIPAFEKDKYNARLTSYDTDLLIGVTGEKTGIFSLEASGAAVDTAESDNTTDGSHHSLGSFIIGEEGLLTVILPSADGQGTGKTQTYGCSAGLLGDTLILSFTLTAPPHKPVGFLPDTTSFIARLVKY